MGENFGPIAAHHFSNSRTEVQCCHRWTHVLSAGQVKGPFSQAEDKSIQDCIQCGVTDWVKIAEHIPGRTAKQVRERWSNHLDPALIHSPWSVSEDRLLIQANQSFGNSWKQIAEVLPGRSENSKPIVIFSSVLSLSFVIHCVTPDLIRLQESVEMQTSSTNESIVP
jgi:hypothetical protein